MANEISSSVNWNPDNQHVQSSIRDSLSVNASTVLIAAGAPRLSSVNQTSRVYNNPIGPVAGTDSYNLDAKVYPLGLIENVGVGQNRPLQQLFEIGSKLRYFIPSRTINQMSISRAYLNGPSLLKVLYAFYRHPDIRGDSIASYPQIDPVDGVGYTPDARNRPGYNDLWLNIASDLFENPVGLLMWFKDSRKTDRGAIYLENCQVTSHNFGLNSSSILFSEAISIQFDRVRPVNLGSPQ